MKHIINPVTITFLTLVLVSGLVLSGAITVSGETPGIIVIIGSDTTWTKSDSPHTLSGPVLVSQGVALTVEAGATVDLNGYEMRVNGTLRAIGTSVNRIVFENGKITFTEYSNAWDEETGTGSIIQFAVLEAVEIVNSVPVSINENPVSDDNVWSKEESPIEFTGAVVVGEGEVLTIEAGVTVEMQGYDLIVEGTLRVLGSSSDKVYFKSEPYNVPAIIFIQTSNGWNEQTGSGCMIDNADISNVNLISNCSLKVTNSKTSTISVGGSSILTGNKLGSLLITGGSPAISGNVIGSISDCLGTPEISNNTIDRIGGFGGSPVISENTITQIGTIRVSPNVRDFDYFKTDSPTITNNIIKDWICLKATGHATVSYNTITGHDYTFQYEKGSGYFTWWQTETATTSGIILEGSCHVFANTIENCYIGIRGGKIIERNLLMNNRYGVEVCSDTTIKNNTFTNNNETISIVKNPSSVTINYNNFESATQDIIWLYGMSNSIDATNNWWGTTD
ncbi:MAG: hypothetical protein CW716_04825, partial [Candidatus Bathyarchaeum sp.]